MAFPDYSYIWMPREAGGRVMVELTRMLIERFRLPVPNIRILPVRVYGVGLESGEVHLWPGIVNKPGLDKIHLGDRAGLGPGGITSI